MYYFDDLLEEIEAHIDQDVDVQQMAKRMNLSVYEFRRIFSFVTKLSFGEYVRKRRLSRAAVELYRGCESITALAARYGYDSTSSFSRAFKEFHGVSPSEVQKGQPFRMLTRLKADIVTAGGTDVQYTLMHKPAFTVSGFAGHSTLTDTECCEDVWAAFEAWDSNTGLTAKTDSLYAVYTDRGDGVDCLIGMPEGDYEATVTVPAGEWACFTLHDTTDAHVNAFYGVVLAQWLASVDYVRNEAAPNIEVYPSDMSEDGFAWQILIPIKREE